MVGPRVERRVARSWGVDARVAGGESKVGLNVWIFRNQSSVDIRIYLLTIHDIKKVRYKQIISAKRLKMIMITQRSYFVKYIVKIY